MKKIRGKRQSPDDFCSTGNSLNKEEKHAEAMEPFKQALSLDVPNAEALYGMGYSCLKLARNEEALVGLSRLSDLTGRPSLPITI